MSQYDTRGAASFLLGGFGQGADVARSVQNQRLAREQMAQRAAEFDADSMRQNARLQMDQQAFAQDLQGRQASADLLSGSQDFSYLMGGQQPQAAPFVYPMQNGQAPSPDFGSLLGDGQAMQLEPQADPFNTTEKAKRELRAALASMPPDQQQLTIARIAQNRRQFATTRVGQTVKRLVEDYKLKNSKILSADPEMAAQVDMWLATAEYDPDSVMDNFDKLREAGHVWRQADAMRFGMGMPSDGMGPPNVSPYAGLDLPNLQSIQTNRIKLADTNAAMQQGIEMGVRKDPRLAGSGAFDPVMAAEQLGISVEEATLLGQPGVRGELRLRMKAETDKTNMNAAAAALQRLRSGESRKLGTADEDFALAREAGLVQQQDVNMSGRQGPKIDPAREKQLQGRVEAAENKLAEVWRLYRDDYDAKAQKKLQPAIEAAKAGVATARGELDSYYESVVKGAGTVTPERFDVPATEPGPTDSSTVQTRGNSNPSAPTPQASKPIDGSTLLSEFSKRFPGVKPDRTNPQHVAAMQAIKAALERGR